MTIIAIQGAAGVDDVPGIDRLADQAELRFAATVDELRHALVGADIMLGWDFAAGGLDQAWDVAGDLRWVHWAGAGIDAMMFPDFAASDVVLTNSRGVFDRAMAEYVLGFVLSFAKRFPETQSFQGKRDWRWRPTHRIAGASALVVGTGSVGREIARVLGANGMVVSGVARAARAGDNDFVTIHGSDDLDGALAGADYVVAIPPLTAETAGMFGAAQFKAMKPTARFINMGRGQLIDEAALIAALKAFHIAGAALDVFETEPLPEASPLWDRPNVIVSPHMSGDYEGHEEDVVGLFVANFERYKAGQPLANVVDKVLGFAAG
jgi:phosphoglycerate dehydrogenase-like enzyme